MREKTFPNHVEPDGTPIVMRIPETLRENFQLRGEQLQKDQQALTDQISLAEQMGLMDAKLADLHTILGYAGERGF